MSWTFAKTWRCSAKMPVWAFILTSLVKWAEAPNHLQSSWIPRVAPVLAVLAAFTAFVWGYWGIATPFLLLVVIEGVLKYRLRKPMESVLEETEHAFHDLDLLSGVLARVEAHTVPLGAACSSCSVNCRPARCRVRRRSPS